MKNMLISIIIPIYKVEKYLKRCIDSVLVQTYSNLQIILVDDGSPDNCPKICDEYASRDTRIEVIHQKNSGVSNARNNGLKIAKGDYVLFIDSDDYIAPDMCEKMLILAEQEKADMVVCNITYTYLHKPNFIPNPILRKPYTQVSSEQALILAITEHSFGDTGMCNKLCKRSLLANFKFKENVRSEDFFALCVLFPKAKKIIYTPQSFYFYFQNPNGVTAQRNLKPRIDSYNAVKFFIEICQKYQYPKALKAIEYRYFDAAVIAAFLILLCDKENKYKSVFDEIMTLGRSNKENIKRSKLTYTKKYLFELILSFPNLMKTGLNLPVIHWGLKKLFHIRG